MIGLYGASVGILGLVRWLRFGSRPGLVALRDWPPLSGQVWNAMIRHQDGTKKDRPVLIWHRWNPGDTSVRVLKITSVDQSKRRQRYVHLPLSEWGNVLSKESWLNLEVTQVPCAAFRSYRGQCPSEAEWDRLMDIENDGRVGHDDRVPVPDPPLQRALSIAAA